MSGLREPFDTAQAGENAKANRVRILIADDNPSVRRYLRGILEQQEGWRVCDEACNGQEVIDHFQEVQPDLVLLDFQMPELNGLQVARTIGELSPQTPILLVSLFLSAELAEEARKAGVRGTCPKTEISSVVDAISALLRKETYFPVLRT